MNGEDLPFRYRAGQPLVWFHRHAASSNQHCPYCGVYLGPGSTVISNREHLIGRKFVPTGSMAGDSFNFIFSSCKACNDRKSAAEGHVSAVSLLHVTEPHAPGIAELAMNKASRQLYPGARGKVVKDCATEKKLDFSLGPEVSMSFNLVGPPQLDKQSVLELAGMQVQALFSMVTTEDPRVTAKMRVLERTQLAILGYYSQPDWGNPQLAELTQRTWPWECPLLIVSANGYFKAVLKRSQDPEDGWFWALEWNRAVRVAGGIFNLDSPPKWVKELPDLGWNPLPGGMRRRREVPLPAEADRLFSCSEDTGEAPDL